MKILHAITLAELGGAQSVVINLANKAAEDGHDVFVASGENGEMWDLLSEKVTAIKLKNIQRAIHPIKDIKACIELRSLEKKIQPDVIHLHSSKMGAIGRLGFSPEKIIYTVHGFDSVRVAFRKFLIVEKLLKNRAKNIVAVSQYDQRNLLNEGIDSNVELIYNGIVDNAQMSISPGYETEIDLLETIKKNNKIVMCIARLAPPKDFELFLKLAAQYKEDNTHFVWIGNKQQVETKEYKNVSVLGEIKNAQTFLRFADVFILPSNYEGLPISILEALSFSKPVVASAVGGIPEVLDGENGFAVENNVENFQSALNKILKTSDVYNKFSVQARTSYEKYFTIDEMYEKYLKLYQQ
jgi:glycosyltransferase involved in cell wall biosynthesis